MRRSISVLCAVLTLTTLGGCSPRDEASVKLDLADKALDRGHRLAAARMVDSAISIDPARESTYRSALEMYARRKHFPEAAGVCRLLLDRARAGRLDRSFSTDEIAGLYASLAQIYEKIPDLPAAEKAYTDSLALSPDSAALLNNLGWFYADHGIKLDKALDLTARAAALAPRSGEIVDSLGWAQYKLGRYNLAVRTLRKAVRLEPDEAELRYHLGAAYLRLGRTIDARIELGKALVLDPGLSEATQLLKSIRN